MKDCSVTTLLFLQQLISSRSAISLLNKTGISGVCEFLASDELNCVDIKKLDGTAGAEDPRVRSVHPIISRTQPASVIKPGLAVFSSFQTPRVRNSSFFRLCAPVSSRQEVCSSRPIYIPRNSYRRLVSSKKFIFFRKNKDGSSWFPLSRAFEGHDLVKATVNEPLRCQAKSARWRSKPWEEIKKTVKVR